jgi:thioester reductase-like protein
MKSYFLTGVTGFVGQELLRLLVRDEDATIACLTRPSQDQDAGSRLSGLLAKAGIPSAARVSVVEGDLRGERLGLEPAAWERLASATTHVIHCAADVSFSRSLEEIRRNNVGGTGNILALTRECRKRNPAFARLDYVSTTYVAGRRSGLALEDELSDRYGFKNFYEQSKHEAEKLVREQWGELPVAIHRPSIVLGMSATGEAKPNNAIYPLLKVFARWKLPLVPANPDCRLDLIPVDYVAAALLHLAKTPASLGKCYHLAAGADHDLRLGRFITMMGEAFHKRIIVVPPWVHDRIVRPLLKVFRRSFYDRTTATFRAFEPYVWEQNPGFSIENAKADLAGSGIEHPDTEAFLRACLEYALKTDFGKITPEKK